MISYDLAKQLKDAGFPQNLDGNRQLNGQPMRHHSHGSARDCDEGCVYVPTLEELVEACNTTFSIYIEGHGADATEAGSEITGSGDTPTEAVAKLWLALNDKPEPDWNAAMAAGVSGTL
jgi:hypothetical protein